MATSSASFPHRFDVSVSNPIFRLLLLSPVDLGHRLMCILRTRSLLFPTADRFKYGGDSVIEALPAIQAFFEPRVPILFRRSNRNTEKNGV